MRGLLEVRNVTSFSADQTVGDAQMLLGIRYDAARGRVTIDGVSGNLAALVDALDVTAQLRPDEVALYVRRRHWWFGWSSQTPLRPSSAGS
jgi:hypothetical protein